MEAPPNGIVTPAALANIKSEKIAITPYEVSDGLFRPYVAKPKEKVAGDIGQAPQIPALGQLGKLPEISSAGPGYEASMTDDVHTGLIPDAAKRLVQRQTRIQKRTGGTPYPLKHIKPIEKLNSMAIETMKPSELVEWMDQVTNKEWRVYTEPDTIIRDAQIASGGSTLSSTAHNKLLACTAVINTDAFFDYWHLFEKICVAFNNTTPNFAFMDELHPGQIGFAINEVDKIRESHPDYTMEVKLYVALKCQEEGLIVLPYPLSHFQEILDKLNIRKETREEYINLKLDVENALQANDIDISKTDSISVAVSRFMACKWSCENGPQEYEETGD